MIVKDNDTFGVIASFSKNASRMTRVVHVTSSSCNAQNTGDYRSFWASADMGVEGNWNFKTRSKGKVDRCTMAASETVPVLTNVR